MLNLHITTSSTSREANTVWHKVVLTNMLLRHDIAHPWHTSFHLVSSLFWAVPRLCLLKLLLQSYIPQQTFSENEPTNNIACKFLPIKTFRRLNLITWSLKAVSLRCPTLWLFGPASHADCRRNDAFKFALTNLAMQISFHDTSIHFVAPGIWNRPCGGYYVIVANNDIIAYENMNESIYIYIYIP